MYRILLAVSLLITTVSCLAGESPDAFCGPFSNWMNAKTGYNAKGDGTTDDAPALQNALNALVNNTTSRVLFIPPGTYLIKSTLTITGTKSCAIIGEDPATTIIKWDGAANGDMLLRPAICLFASAE